jgi:hypothetical protein
MRLRAALLLAALATSAGADVVCQSRKGGVFLRAECRKRETVITLPVDAPKGATGEAGPAAPAPVRLVDATGKPLGEYAEPGTEDNATYVLFSAGERFLYLFANATGLQSGGDTLLHVAADCGGAPVLPGRMTDFVRGGVILDDAVWVASDPIAPATVSAREYAPLGNCGTDTLLPNGHCCQTVVPGETLVGPATQAFEVPVYTPPLRLEP